MYYASHSYGKGKSKYSLPGNLLYCLKLLWEWKKTAVFMVALVFIPTILAEYAATLLPTVVVKDMEEQVAVQVLLFHIAGLCLLMWIGNTCNEISRTWMNVSMPAFLQSVRKKFTKKIMDLDYDRLEDEKSKETIGNVIAALRHGRGLYSVPEFLISGSSCFLLLVFFGVLIARAGAWLLAVVMVTFGLNYVLIAIARKKHAKYYGQNSQYAARTDYISNQAMDASAGKDIRLYQLLDFFLKKYDDSLKEMDFLFGKIHFWYHIRGIASGFLTLFRNGCIYGGLVYVLTKGKITASQLVYYISLLSTFGGYFNWLVYMVMGYNSANVSMDYIRDFLNWENQWGKNFDEKKDILVRDCKKYNVCNQQSKRDIVAERKEKNNELGNIPAKLELRHVSFYYEGSKTEVLKDVNLILQPGEKLALLGLNGAGKTTLTKLICGFYEPTKGEILLNDKPVREYDRQQYYDMISVLFQDYTILPMTVDENLTSIESQYIDKEKLNKTLSLAGFWSRYMKLQNKGETKLVKEVQEESINFSGGEYQKLLFARALYKEAPLIILDEPTAALDPIAENELYQHFSEATNHASVIYISHRLASTQFCDRIVLLEEGRIVEEGTHESLMQAKGKYEKLYELQSQYYKEEVQEVENA